MDPDSDAMGRAAFNPLAKQDQTLTWISKSLEHKDEFIINPNICHLHHVHIQGTSTMIDLNTQEKCEAEAKVQPVAQPLQISGNLW